MPRGEYDVRVLPSVLDRLIDSDPKNSRDPVSTRAESVGDFTRAVQRNLEHLLNTRNGFYDLPTEFVEVGHSVLCFGLSDFSNLNLTNPNDRSRLRQLIETTIRTFEPRLAGVKVLPIPGKQTDRSLRFRIEARLLVEPTTEPVTFDMVLELDTHEYKVDEGE